MFPRPAFLRPVFPTHPPETRPPNFAPNSAIGEKSGRPVCKTCSLKFQEPLLENPPPSKFRPNPCLLSIPTCGTRSLPEGVFAVPLRARLLDRLAIALATPPPPPGNLPPGRLLLPAPMPGDRPHRPTLPPARDGSIAAAPQPHSPRAPHGRPRQAYLRRSRRRRASSPPRPLWR